jgi:hypothetical protein
VAKVVTLSIIYTYTLDFIIDALILYAFGNGVYAIEFGNIVDGGHHRESRSIHFNITYKNAINFDQVAMQ